MKKILTASTVAILAFAVVASAAAFNANLTVGSTGADVTALQTALIGAGYSIPAGATGYFGSQTKAAVMKYQAAKSIPATGFVGPLTRAALNGGTVATAAPFVCPAGYSCQPNVVTNGTATTPSTGASTAITTTGIEGILTVTQGPISNTVVNVGQTAVPILAVRAQAQNSDIAIQRITLDLGTDTKIYNKIYTKLYITDGANILATVPLNSSTVVQSGSRYLVTVTGFSDVVARNTYKDFVVKADLYTAIDSTVITGHTFTVSLASSQAVRGIDGAGIDQYGGDNTVAQTVTVNSSLVDTAIANVSTDSATPQTQSVPVSDTTNGQYLQLPVLIFDIGSQNDSLHLHQVQVDIGGTGTGTTSAAYLYQGSTQISSASVVAGTATFTNIVDGTAGASIPLNTTVPFTLKVDITGVTSGSVTVIPQLDIAGTVIYNSIDSSVTPNGSAPGFTTTVLGKGPAFAIQGTPSISVSGTNQSGSTQSTSTITATFNVGLQAVGSNVYLSSQASTTNAMFAFKVYNGAGTDVTSTLVNASSGFIIPSAGVITVGQAANSFYVPQQNSAVIGNVTFQFAGKDATGAALTAGPYSVQLDHINWSSTGAGSATSTTSFAGLSNWRTSGINP